MIEVENLHTRFYTDDGVVRAVDGVSFSAERGETLAIVGESGCGKSVTALSILRLVSPPGRIVSGSIRLDGTDLLQLSRRRIRAIRGNRISMIFQEPMTSLNPVFTIGDQIVEAIRTHERLSRTVAKRRAIEMLERVRIPDAAHRFSDYPHQLSGGMRQRVMIAMALACRPEVLIADEPTTALDVTIQAQIMELLRELQDEFAMTVLLITHNLGLVASVAHRVAVMYSARVVEYTTTRRIFEAPLHPYTRGLLASVPRLGMPADVKLHVIPGSVPNPLRPPNGCRFHPRCSLGVDRCRAEIPDLERHQDGHLSACHRVEAGVLPAPEPSTAAGAPPPSLGVEGNA